MPIPFICPSCASKLGAPDSPGQTTKCPKCGTTAVVPLPAGEVIPVAELDDDPPLPNHPSSVSPRSSAITDDWQRLPTSPPLPAANLMPKVPLPWKRIMLGVGISVGLGVLLLLLVLFLPWVTLTLGLVITLTAVYTLAQGGEFFRRIMPAGAPPRLSCAGAIIAGGALLALSTISVVHNRRTDAANRQVVALTEKARQHIASREWDQAEAALKEADAAKRSDVAALLVQVKEGREQDRHAYDMRVADGLFRKAAAAIEHKQQDEAIVFLKQYANHHCADPATKKEIMLAVNANPIDVLTKLTDKQFDEWLQNARLPPPYTMANATIATFFEQQLRPRKEATVKLRNEFRLARLEAERKNEANRQRKAAEDEARKKQEEREARGEVDFKDIKREEHPSKSGTFFKLDVLIRENVKKQAIMALADVLRKKYAHKYSAGVVIGIWDSEDACRRFDDLPESEAYRHFLAEVQIVGLRDDGECFWVADTVAARRKR